MGKVSEERAVLPFCWAGVGVDGRYPASAPLDVSRCWLEQPSPRHQQTTGHYYNAAGLLLVRCQSVLFVAGGWTRG